jgi:hypothetical protein
VALGVEECRFRGAGGGGETTPVATDEDDVLAGGGVAFSARLPRVIAAFHVLGAVEQFAASDVLVDQQVVAAHLGERVEPGELAELPQSGEGTSAEHEEAEFRSSA